MPPRMVGLGPSGAPPSYSGAPSIQFRPGGPPQPGQQFMPPGAQQYRPGSGLGPPQQIGMPPPSMGGMNAQPTQPYTAPHLQQRPSQPSPQAPPLSQGMGMPYPVQQRPMSTGHPPPQQQQLQPSSMPQVPGPGNHALQPAAPYPVRIPTALHKAACEVELISCCLISSNGQFSESFLDLNGSIYFLLHDWHNNSNVVVHVLSCCLWEVSMQPVEPTVFFLFGSLYVNVFAVPIILAVPPTTCFIWHEPFISSL
jgi:hypothetical protein